MATFAQKLQQNLFYSTKQKLKTHREYSRFAVKAANEIISFSSDIWPTSLTKISVKIHYSKDYYYVGKRFSRKFTNRLENS